MYLSPAHSSNRHAIILTINHSPKHTMTNDGTNADNSTISTQEGEAEAPPNKKIKSGDEGEMEQALDSEWPEAWLMPKGECADQKAPNKLDPNVPVTVEELKALGIS